MSGRSSTRYGDEERCVEGITLDSSSRNAVRVKLK